MTKSNANPKSKTFKIVDIARELKIDARKMRAFARANDELTSMRDNATWELNVKHEKRAREIINARFA